MPLVTRIWDEKPWETEDVQWREELPRPEGDPTAEQSWERWAGGGDYAPGDGGGRWRHPLAFTMRMLRLAGVWRPRDVVWRKGQLPRDILYHVYTFVTASLFLFFTVSGLINIKYHVDLSHLTDLISMVAVSVFNGAKVTPMLFRRRRVERCLYLLRASLRLGPPLETRSKDIDKFSRQVRVVTKVLACWGYFITAAWLSTPLLAKLLGDRRQDAELAPEFNATSTEDFTAAPTTEKPPRPLPFAVWFPLDTRDDLNYGIGIFIQALGVVVDDTYSVLANTFWVGMLHGGCLSLRMLRASLRELSPESQPSPDAHLARCIRQHQAILSLVREVSELLGPIILVESLNMMILFTCVIFHASSLGLGNMKIMASAAFLSYEVMELGLFCYFATELMWESQQVANDVYYSQWFRCSAGTRKSVYFVMLRAFTPSVVNVSGFTVLGLDLFSALIRASYSMLALLQQVNND